MKPADQEAVLASGARELGLALGEDQLRQLHDYLALLSRWNKVYNLTAVRDPGDMLRLHLLDCLAAVLPLRRMTEGKAVHLLDVGSGGGLPGLVIAICCPDIKVTCVDTVAKKTAFIHQAGASLALGNLRVRHQRVEEIGDRFDVIASRAFASLADFVHLSAGALAEGGIWMAMKGKRPADEIALLTGQIEVFHVEPLSVPTLHAERCIVWMRKKDAVSAVVESGMGKPS